MISHIDHIVLTVEDIERSLGFYSRVLLMEAVSYPNGRKALKFGHQKINLQLLGQESRNQASVGSGDLCLISEWPLPKIMEHLHTQGIEIIEGPVQKNGACGTITSVYFLDPDKNLVEVSVYPVIDQGFLV
ncbi:VOC family protein [Cesiribacter sp. SM1]|uniref:VOC family protein n=1 Tax=Cesiribacter sp. SM1 TaxID=2861196 RepID=UPI001CD34855|nr:VOC family protein [Cesiribacter sp. SM1]